MRIKILGSGGSIPTPKIGCSCSICKKARQVGIPYRRHSSALYLYDANALFDCPEDISASLNPRLPLIIIPTGILALSIYF